MTRRRAALATTPPGRAARGPRSRCSGGFIDELRPCVACTAAVAVATLLAASQCAPASGDGAERITVTSWGGAYGKAVHEGVNIPFTEATGTRIDFEDYNGGLAQIRAQVDIGSIYWDVIDLEIADAVRGCDEGLLEPLDLGSLLPGADGSAAAADYPPDSHTECAAATIYWSTIYAYNAEHVSGAPPTTMDDFFDLERFPGRRGMRRVPQVNLEFALIADGVPVDEVYAVLASEGGVDRAFRKLDTIKDEVVWWEAGAQPPQMLADGEVAMTTAYNGRVFNAQVLESQPFVIVWDGQVLSVGQLAIVAGTPRLEAAKRYLSFFATAESLARIGRRISYSPVRHSGRPLVTTHVVTGDEMAPHMPALQAETSRSLIYGWAWWADHKDEMNERFSAWLSR